MSLGASSSRVPLYRPSWTERTFVNSDEAEDALCRDRPGFIMRREILKLIPRKIKRHITHPGDNAQIKGFQELFIYLNKHPGSERLRWAVAGSSMTLFTYARTSVSNYSVLPAGSTLMRLLPC